MTTFTRWHLSLLTVLFLATPAHADLDQIKRAAEYGDVAAQLELGILYHYGFHYKDNEVNALVWYTLAANQGDAKAAGLRDTLRAKMTQKDVDEAQTLIAQHKPKATPVTAPTVPAPAPVPETSPPPFAETPVPVDAPAQPEATPAPTPEAK